MSESSATKIANPVDPPGDDGPNDEAQRTDRLTRNRSERYRTSAKSGRGALFPWRVATLVVVAIVLGVVYSQPSAGYLSYAFALSTVYAIAVLGGNLVTGFLGETNLAQGGLIAVGGYTSVYFELHHQPLLLCLLYGTLAGALVAAVLACAVIKLTGVYTALVTFSLSFAIPDLILYFSSVTGGGNGRSVPADTMLFGALIGGSTPETVWLVTVVFALCGLVFLAVTHSRAGRLLYSASSSVFAATSFGINGQRVKWFTWIGSGALCGLSGCLYALVVGNLDPTQFTLYLSLYLLVGTLAGGPRTVMGAWIGGALVGALPIVMSSQPGGAEPVILGGVLLAVILLGGGGIWPRVELAAVWVVRTVATRLRSTR